MKPTGALIWDALMASDVPVPVTALADAGYCTAPTVRKWVRWWERAGFVATLRAGRGAERATPHVEIRRRRSAPPRVTLEAGGKFVTVTDPDDPDHRTTIDFHHKPPLVRHYDRRA